MNEWGNTQDRVGRSPEGVAGRDRRRGAVLGCLALALFLLLGGLALPAHGYDVVLVQSAAIAPYDEAADAFRSTLSANLPALGPKSVGPAVFEAFTLSEAGAAARLTRRLRARRPDLLVAVGAAALDQLSREREVPVVFLGVPPPRADAGRRPNVTGVRLEISPVRWVDALGRISPGAKRVGLVYDPARTGDLVRQVRELSWDRSIWLVAREVADPREVPAALARLQGEVDAFWILPDLTAVTPATVESILLFSMQWRIPVLTFSERHLGQGAAAALAIDFAALGEQAAALAASILAGAAPADVPQAMAEGTLLRLNPTVLRKLVGDVGMNSFPQDAPLPGERP